MHKLDSKCLICGNEAKVGQRGEITGTFNFCERCGDIYFDPSVDDYFDNEESEKFKSCLYYYFTHLKRVNDKPFLITNRNIKDEKFNIVSLVEILNVNPAHM